MASLTIRRAAAALSGSVFRTAVRASGASVRFQSSKGDDGSMSNGDITKYFLDLDAKTPKEKASTLPVRLSGRTGQLVAEMYTAGQAKGNFDKLVKELEAFLNVVEGAGLVVDRFFSTSNYSEVECKKVLDLLMTTKEPLTSFASIKDAEVKEILVDNESNMAAWQGARKAVGAIGLSDTTKALLDSMAAEGNLSRAKRVLVKATEVRSATSKSLEATVSSAVGLTKAQQETIAKSLPQYVGGASVSPSFIVDPAVLGGLTVSFRNSSIDLSATTRLIEVVAQQQKLA